MEKSIHKNVFGKPLETCCTEPITGFYRDGFCHTGEKDFGSHVTCAEMTTEFLEFSKSKGNDLMTPKPEFNFQGLKAGDCWCLCASRWVEAYKAGVAPKIKLSATHEKMLEFATLNDLKEFALEAN